MKKSLRLAASDVGVPGGRCPRIPTTRKLKAAAEPVPHSTSFHEAEPKIPWGRLKLRCEILAGLSLPVIRLAKGRDG